MFELINEEKRGPEKRKLLLVKVAAFVVAIAATAGVVYFIAFAYSK